MKMIQIVETLISQGHKVTFRIRSDGGIIIKTIDGKKYSITDGNKTARKMVIGGELSEARLKQTTHNVEKFIKLKEGQKKAKGSIDEILNKTLKRVQRVWRKNKIKGEGELTKKNLRWYIKTYGKKRALEYLENRERYAQGYAYKENVDYLVERIKRLKKELPLRSPLKSVIDDLCQKISIHWKEFKEIWINPIYEVCYEKVSVEERIRKIKAILPVSWF